jgi:hypothetical protein
MKKALIAAAVAGAFAAPSAMAAELSTNVYWSTAITMGETTTTAADGTSAGVDRGEVHDAGGNRLMFTWTDTLDNGIGVNAYLSFGNLNTAGGQPDFAANTVSVRNANIGFSGDFGKVQVGTNEHFTETDLLFDPSYGDFGATGDAISYINVGNTGFNFTRRDGESVWFTSNDMNGLQLRAVYIMGPQDTTNATADANGTQIGLTYTSGPLMVGVSQASYEDYAIDGSSAAPIAGSEATMTTLRGSYDMGMVNIKVATWTIEQTGITDVTETAVNAIGYEVTGRSIYIGMPVAGGTLWAQSSSLGDQDVVAAAGGTSALDASDKSGWDIGYHHAMNSQVNFFVRYGESETGVNFDETDGSTETTQLMLGWQLMY